MFLAAPGFACSERAPEYADNGAAFEKRQIERDARYVSCREADNQETAIPCHAAQGRFGVIAAYRVEGDVDAITCGERLHALLEVLGAVVDDLVDEATGRPTYIEANPRLVEPMNATLSGVNLADLTVRVSLGEVGAPGDPRCGQPGIHSHSLLAILLGIADHGGSRRELLRTIIQDMRGRGIFAGSREDLTPVHVDPPSFIPLGVVSGQLLLRPRSAHHIATGTVNSYSLSATAVETIIAL